MDRMFWVVSKLQPTIFSIEHGTHQQPIGFVYCPCGSDDVPLVKEARDHTKIIVRAVNSHEDLVSALAGIIAVRDTDYETDTMSDRSELDDMNRAIDIARNALAKARRDQ